MTAKPVFYLDFSSKETCDSLISKTNTETPNCVTLMKNTSIGYDENVGALRIAAEKEYSSLTDDNPYSGVVNCFAPTGAETMDACPYFVAKIKLADKNTGFGTLFVRASANGRLAWQGDPAWECYQSTEEWQLIYGRVDKSQNRNFTGNWIGVSLHLASAGTPFKAGETIAWMAWCGVFASLEEAYTFAGLEKPAMMITPNNSMKNSIKTDYSDVRPLGCKPVSRDLSMFPVTEKIPIQEEAARVNHNLSKPLKKLSSEHALVQEFNPEYAFNMHGGLAIFKGKLFASFSRAVRDEDAPAQQAVVCSMPLDDFGNWSDPMLVGPPVTAADGVHLSSNLAGFLHTDGETLYLNFAKKEYAASSWDADGNYLNAEHMPISWVNMVSYTTDGIHWSEPVAAGISANESPRQSLTGHWFAGAGKHLLYSAEENPGTNWRAVGPTQEQIQDALSRGAPMLTEASWYQTDDYVLHLMLRSNSKYIWMSNSYDNGQTWTDIYPTNFAADTTMANFGRLPDGRYYFVGSDVYGSLRFPLRLYVSRDGYNFDTGYVLRDEPYMQRRYGYAKNGVYNYPEVLFDSKYMYVIYSKQKEVMEVTRVQLSDIL